MNKTKALGLILLLSASLFCLAGIALAQDDAEGCQDHPVLSRMKNFFITNCVSSDFDSAEFYVTPEETKTVEGKKLSISYEVKEGVPVPSELQIRRNYINAVKSLGGSVLCEFDNFVFLKVVKNGREMWVSVETHDNGMTYSLVILETGGMVQEVTASDMLAALNADGFIALYINFDTGQAKIKPESQSIVDQIAVLLKDNPDLRLSVEGHTDNVGSAASNKTLSEQRAKAVVAALVVKGVAAGRLSAVGWGAEKPVADNRAEEGRAKNRRVEIVKK